MCQDNACLSKMRTGTFTYLVGVTTITVKRTKSKQVESFNNGKSKVIVNKIRWSSDNEYTARFVKAINAPGCLEKGELMKVAITGCELNKYTVRISSDRCGEAETIVTKID